MLIQWRRQFEIGVEEVDAEHRHLAHLVNSFYDLFRAGAGADKVYTVLNLLVQYVETHFKHEEGLMEAGGYPELERHRALHDTLTEQIFTLNEQCAAGVARLTQATMEFLKTWLLDHILHEDMLIAAHLQGRALPPGFHGPGGRG
ncbi:MAG: bacteriohemerythrin [Deferrisomatales bacterium]|nr:bacteriohemerythrin [Deferrisomatales bacterium]